MSDDPKIWQRRYEREKNARKQAEALLEEKSSELYEANLKLAKKVEIESSRSERELKKFTELFHSSIDGIVLYDTSGNILDANQAFISLLQQDNVSLKEAHLSDFYAASSRPSFGYAHSELLEKGSNRFESEFTRADGSAFPAEISTTKFEVEGEIIIQAIVRDVTQAKQQEQELKNASEIAVKANQAKSLFLATMSHEIRTPLNGILGFTDILLLGSITSEQEDHLNIIKKSGDMLLNIINDILDFSRIESNQIELEHADYNLTECIEETLEILAQQAAIKQVDLLYFIEEDVPLQLNGDIGRLRQILLNLISNGLKFTNEGSVRVNVSLASASRIQFSIIDTGVGFDEQITDQLFSAFQQADASTTRKYGGTGLGLAICKQLIEAMGGDITAHSTPGNGAEFFITLPLEKALSPLPLSLSTDFLKGKKILVVDDHPTNLEYFAARLSHWQSIPTLASHPQEALALLAQSDHSFDLLLIDMLMPEMDGITLATRIREQYPHHAPMLLVTSARLEGEVDTALKVGYHKVVYKPVREKDILSAMQSALATLEDPADKKQPDLHLLTERDNAQTFCLVVEDNAVNAKLAKIMLERIGFVVHIAHNGQEAIDTLLLKPIYKLIFMDMQMPIMDGIEATIAIRKGKAGPTMASTPIIAMTANAMKQDESKCLAAGMNEFVPKPIRIDKLNEVVAKFTPN